MHQLYALGIFAALVYVILRLYLKAQRAPYPPGPKPLPFVGNLFDLPRTKIGQHYAGWRPVVSMHVFGRKFVHLNTAQAATELLEKRSGTYSDRPHLVMAGDLVDRKNAVLFHPYGERLRKYRRLLHSALNLRSSSEFWPLQETQSRKFLVHLLKSPTDFLAHIRRSTGAVILRVAYGYEVSKGEDYYITLSEELAKITTEASEIGWMVDSFPILRHLPSWLPGMHFKRWARHARRLSQEFTDAPFIMVKNQMREGTAAPSFTSKHLEREGGRQPTAQEEDIVKFAAAGLYAGGTDTTVALITAFFLLMVTHPDIQTKAQMEIDAVVGRDRIPGMSDKDALPYIDAVIKELHRFNPIVPLIPHSLAQDDVYEGYLIPKGAWVMANSWSILHDPSTYPEPHRFSPERYSSTQEPTQPDPRAFAFGYGRRICPAIHFTNASTYLAVAQTLWAFNLKVPLNSDGTPVPIDLDGAFTDGHVSHPKPFQCTIEPRSPHIVELLSSASPGE